MVPTPDAHPTDCYVDWVLEHYRALPAHGSQPPLIVPLTATFKPGSIRPVEVLLEFERFYARLCSLLVNNHDRPNKRHLLPFAIAWRDDPRTRPDKYRARPAWHAQFFTHPSVAPHVHGLLVIHPQLVDRFRSISRELEAEWRGIRTFVGSSRDVAVTRNRTLQLDLEAGNGISRGLAGDVSSRANARSELAGWLGYSSKLGSRWDAGDSDLFTVLPAPARRAEAAGIGWRPAAAVA